jgi:segregation and condensation protein A
MKQEAYALIRGKPVDSLPKDLYIPPDALQVFLEAFEGPLDLLLYLIKKQNIDILDIPIAEITRQYIEYIGMMKELRLELAAEYLVMAVILAEIKSRMLLPKLNNEENEEEDPRAELIRRLQEYERCKKIAEDIDLLPQVNRDIFLTNVQIPQIEIKRPLPQVDLQDLCFAFKEVLLRAQMYANHYIQRETLSIRERMSQILIKLQTNKFTDFIDLFTIEEGSSGVIVVFAAILELSKQMLIEMVQTESFGKIHIRKIG